MKASLVIPCDCHCSILELSVDEHDDTVYISHFSSTFYQKQENWWFNLKHKIEFIWMILNNKEFRLYDVIVRKDDFDRIVEEYTGKHLN